MPETHQRSLRVFLCHAHSDKDAVKALYDCLVKDGVDAWLDKEKLLPGADWEYEIRKAVRESDVVVICLSCQFNQAGFRQKEVRIPLDEADKQPEGEIFIIPARMEECDPPESLSKWHWVNLFEPDGYDYLMRAFCKRAERIGAVLQPTKKGGLFGTKTQTKPKPLEVKKVEAIPLKPKLGKTIAQEAVLPTSETENDIKEKDEVADDADQAKIMREIKRKLEKLDKEEKQQLRKIRRIYKWDSFWKDVRYRLAIIRIYYPVILSVLFAFAAVIFLIFYISKNISKFSQSPTQTQLAPTSTLASPTPSINLCIGIIAGDSGTYGAVCENGTTEEQVNKTIADIVVKTLSALGYNADLLQEFDTRLKGYNGTVLLSIHNDSCNDINEQATGFKVAVSSRSNDSSLSNRFLVCLEDRYANITGLSLHSSITTDMTENHAFQDISPSTTAAIIFTGFLLKDYAILTEHPDIVANGIVNGILCFINNEYIAPTPTPTIAPLQTCHVDALTETTSDDSERGVWNAGVTINIHDSNQQDIQNAVVDVTFSTGSTDDSLSCITDQAGKCMSAKTGISKIIKSITFTVKNVDCPGMIYAPSMNDITTVKLTQP
jgi:N-acetylmuramoyl-L-alanine amidase